MTIMREQQTFEGMGKLPVLPVAKHPEDMVICEDTVEWKRRVDCLISADGKTWWYEDDRDEHEESLVHEYLDGVIERSDEYRASEECGGEYAYLIWENRERMEENVNEWLEDNVEEYKGCPDSMLYDICEELHGIVEFDCSRGHFGRSSHDVDFDSFEVGEVEEQVDINDVPLLKTLHDRGALEGILEELDSEFCLYRYSRPIMGDGRVIGWDRDPYISGGDYPSITLMNNTDLWYWFGCSEETLLEVYNKHVNGNF